MPDKTPNISAQAADKAASSCEEPLIQAQGEDGAEANRSSTEKTQTSPELKAPPLPDEPKPSETVGALENCETSDPEPADLNPSPKNDAPPLPDEPAPEIANDSAPPLPEEPVPEDDGWDYRWDAVASQYIFFNRFTGVEQLENPRLGESQTNTVSSTANATTSGESIEAPAPPEILGYNPAIHGDYDPNAWYAKLNEPQEPVYTNSALGVEALEYGSQAPFNRLTGHFQATGEGSDRHNADAKAKRQLHSYFDVDAAANAHHGRSLRAERQGQRLSKNELKQYKEKRKARKEEKRRAWLRE
ncbi:uncharacterized protein BROUX77_002912 [Berkeleyomyces rouxiae]|uniref:uncharacterized protein n=1 Tax=Berkeleyomyces rouxiae TaxID=2035830 RepID=UPI003B79C374